MDKIGWADCVRDEVLRRVKEERNTLHAIKESNANWIGHILCTNFLLKYFIEEEIERRIEGKRRRGRRRKHILDRVNKANRYWNLKEETLYRSVWRPVYGRGYGPVVRIAVGWSEYKKQNVLYFTVHLYEEYSLFVFILVKNLHLHVRYVMLLH
jgi:hypothetical protein